MLTLETGTRYPNSFDAIASAAFITSDVISGAMPYAEDAVAPALDTFDSTCSKVKVSTGSIAGSASYLSGVVLGVVPAEDAGGGCAAVCATVIPNNTAFLISHDVIGNCGRVHGNCGRVHGMCLSINLCMHLCLGMRLRLGVCMSLGLSMSMRLYKRVLLFYCCFD